MNVVIWRKNYICHDNKIIKQNHLITILNAKICQIFYHFWKRTVGYSSIIHSYVSFHQWWWTWFLTEFRFLVLGRARFDERKINLGSLLNVAKIWAIFHNVSKWRSQIYVEVISPHGFTETEKLKSVYNLLFTNPIFLHLKFCGWIEVLML